MNKYFYDDIFISIELGRQSASTGRATSYCISHIWNRCLFSYSTLRLTVTLLSLLTPTFFLSKQYFMNFGFFAYGQLVGQSPKFKNIFEKARPKAKIILTKNTPRPKGQRTQLFVRIIIY